MSGNFAWIEDGDTVSDCGWTQSDDTMAWAFFISIFVLMTTVFAPYLAYSQACYLLRRRARRRANAIAESTP